MSVDPIHGDYTILYGHHHLFLHRRADQVSRFSPYSCMLRARGRSILALPLCACRLTEGFWMKANFITTSKDLKQS
jgi:hypothetical protein